uniref:Uncharacterized protein n=1 Tax=Leptospira ellisii TaxID=2023197 RepID=A0A2N0BE67_9LEPT|nr:hypothetical protein CH379_00715 [Leptospira ellisii]
MPEFRPIPRKQKSAPPWLGGGGGSAGKIDGHFRSTDFSVWQARFLPFVLVGVPTQLRTIFRNHSYPISTILKCARCIEFRFSSFSDIILLFSHRYLTSSQTLGYKGIIPSLP